MRSWIWAGLVAAGLAAGVGLELRAAQRPATPPAFSVVYPPRTLPEHTTLALLNPQHAALWRSGEPLSPEALERAAYLSFRLPGGLSYTYTVAKAAASLEALEVWIGDQRPTLGTLVHNRGYVLSTVGELERDE